MISSISVNSQTVPPTPTCVSCGGKNGVHATSCPYYNPPAGRQKSVGPKAEMPSQIQELNTLINLFNSIPDDNVEETQQTAVRKKAFYDKLREDSLRREHHAVEMKTFKPLDSQPNVVRFDKPSGSGEPLKILPSSVAPMSMEERERQKILRNGAGVTWQYDDFSNVSSAGKIPEPEPQPELSENEKLVNEVIAQVESNGGRLASITGRYILNIKEGVMRYLDDAVHAASSGNTYLMQETGEFDVRKITTNALYNTINQTAQVYYVNVKESLASGLKDGSIGIISKAGINKLNQYQYFNDLSGTWHQIHH